METPTGLIDWLLAMDNRALATLLLTLGLPWVYAVVFRARWRSWIKATLAIGGGLGAVAIYLVAADEWQSGDWLRMSLIVIIGSALIYRLYHRPISDLEEMTG